MQEENAKEKILYDTGGAYTKDNICVSIEYDSRELVNTLIKFNLHQNKSGKEIPYIFKDLELQKAYIRGMIDGDGHIEPGYFKYVGSLESCEYIKNYFEQWIEYDKKYKYIYNYGSIYSFEVRRNEISKIIEYIYKDAKIYLNRKYTIAVSKSRN